MYSSSALRSMRACPLLVISCGLVVVAGCGGSGSNGGAHDAGGGTLDAGGSGTSDAGTVPRVDAGVTTVDSGSARHDAGPELHGTTAHCGDCTADSDCVEGDVCVPLATYRWCFPVRTSAPAGDCAALRPYSGSDTVTTASGRRVEVCLPRKLCPAIRDFMRPCPTELFACGGPGEGDGATCWGTRNRCTLECDSDLDCPTTSTCSPDFHACVW